MTILAKPSNNKNAEKVPLPLADEVAMLAATAPPAHGTLSRQQSHGYHSDADAESMVFNRPPQLTCLKTIILFVLSVLVMMMGILGGYSLYRLYAPPYSAHAMHYHALCDIPYESNNLTLPRFYDNADDMELSWRRLMSHFRDPIVDPLNDDNYFREEIDLDLSNDESFTKIDVPDFKDGRRGRFMHDFKENQSAIIDTSANRCFIMPLDRETTLPPKSFMDLVQKMGSGYYNIDTDSVRKRMRVVLPPITDLSLVSERIANECYDMKVYMLENYVSGVFKREAKIITESGKFAEFSGKKTLIFDLMNIADVEEYERQQHKQ